MSNPEAQASDNAIASPAPPHPQDGLDPVQRMLAVGMEVSKRAAELRSLDELYYFLVNDLRILIEFDRCLLITHLGGHSRFAAANHQPTLQTKSKFYARVEALAWRVRQLDKGIFITGEAQDKDFPREGITEEQKEALGAFVRSSQAKGLLVVPLIQNGVPRAHLIFEFLGQTFPEGFKVMALLNMAPLFASVLVEKWLIHKKPQLLGLLHPDPDSTVGLRNVVRRHAVAIAVGAASLLAVLFLFPIDYTVGGEATIVPWERYLAFCKTDGIIEKVRVAEGASVSKDQTVATLDPTELNFKIDSAERQSEILARRIILLRREGDTSPSKLGDLKIVELERQKVLKELQFLRWQSQFLEIKAPVAGIVLTKDVESLAGKKMRAGEPFCEIASPIELAVEILLPEDRVAFAQQGQTAYCYLNHNPLKGYELRLDEISPAAEALPRLGNVCRARAKFLTVPSEAKVGMKGVGKIHTFRTNLWFVLRQGIATRWNRLALYW